MFELAAVRPPHWPSLEIPQRPGDELNRSQQSGKIVCQSRNESLLI